MQNKCTVLECKYPFLHNSLAHHCSICFGNHSNTLHNNTNKNIFIKCPICRQSNELDINQKKISGSTDKCCVCLDKEIEIFLPKCGHACLCSACADVIKEEMININNKIISFNNIPNQVISEAVRKYGDLTGNIYCIVYGGMGCCWYVRKNSNNNIDGFFMHSDSWGQYGESTDETPYLNTFIQNFIKI